MKPAVHRRGNGPPLYAHPGGPGLSAAEFIPELDRLERSFEISYVDPRGTGKTPKPSDPRAYALDDYVADLAELIEEPSYVLGFSHGGLVAQRFAVRFPSKSKGLVLASTAARFSSDMEAGLARTIEASAGAPWLADALEALRQEQAGEFEDDVALARIVAREMPLYFHEYDDHARRWVESLASHPYNGDALRYFNDVEFLSVDLRAEIDAIAVPTVIVSGASDFICPPEAGREMEARITGSRLTVIPCSGHMTYVEQPDAFYEAVVALLK